jgi:hypothetical protein
LAAIFGVKDVDTRKMHIYVFAGHTRVIGPTGKWKTLSVAFTGAIVDVVLVATSDVGTATTQLGGTFFQTADLEGGTFFNGHAATVTFDESVDMSAVQIDLTSFNTYVVQRADHDCVPAEGSPCPALPALYFPTRPGTAGWGSVVLTTAYELYAFGQAEAVTQVSMGFNHNNVDSWGSDTFGNSWQVVKGEDSFGVWQPSGGVLPTATKLASITPPEGACVGPCIDPHHANSNVEDTNEPLRLYDLVYVYDVQMTSFFNPCATCAAVENDATGVIKNPVCKPAVREGVDICQTDDAPPRMCFEDNPCGLCDEAGNKVGDGPGEGNPMLKGFCSATFDREAFPITFVQCSVRAFNFGDCWQNGAACVPPSCYIAE